MDGLGLNGAYTLIYYYRGVNNGIGVAVDVLPPIVGLGATDCNGCLTGAAYVPCYNIATQHSQRPSCRMQTTAHPAPRHGLPWPFPTIRHDGDRTVESSRHRTSTLVQNLAHDGASSTVGWCSWLSRQSNTLKVPSSSLGSIKMFRCSGAYIFGVLVELVSPGLSQVECFVHLVWLEDFGRPVW